jgi:hypothetical protein
MFQSNTLLLPLPISNQPNHNITQKNNTIPPYFKPFLTINITPLYISLNTLLLPLPISKQPNHNIINIPNNKLNPTI